MLTEWSERAGALPKNNPALVKPTKILSRGGYCIAGREVPAGENIVVEWHLARDLVHVGKAEFVA